MLQTIIVLALGGACPQKSLLYLPQILRLPVVKAQTNVGMKNVRHLEVLLRKNVIPIPVVAPLATLKRIDSYQVQIFEYIEKLLSSYNHEYWKKHILKVHLDCFPRLLVS